MRPGLLLWLFCFLCSNAGAQKENNIWTMGNGLGLDFNGGNPVFTTSGLNTKEGCAAVCDTSGALLFYSDGRNVYDRLHHIMPNGRTLAGDPSTTQGVAIAAVKNDDSSYYLFTLMPYLSKGDLRYSRVNMRLNGGLGDIDTPKKNIWLGDKMSEKMIIAGTCNRQWLIVHHMDSAIFYSYNLDTLSAAPVVSRSGYFRVPNGFSAGELKVSPRLDRIAMASHWPGGGGFIDLFDFDITNGLVSNQRVVDSVSKTGSTYGLEFSPDGRKLYEGTADAAAMICQYDLSLGSIFAIRASRYDITVGSEVWGMRRGPDKMIYLISNSVPDNFSRIPFPDMPGSACGFEKNFLTPSFTPTGICTGFGNYFIPRQSSKQDTVYSSRSYKLCSGKSVSISAGKVYDELSWNDGDTNADRIFYSPGTYWAYTRLGCNSRIDTFHLVPTPLDTTYNVRLDTTICEETSIVVKAPPGRNDYTWSDGDTLFRKRLVAPALVWLRSQQECSTFIDTFIIRANPSDVTLQHLDTTVCFSPSAQLSAPGGDFDTYTWSAGNTGTDTTLYSSARFSVDAVRTRDCRILRQSYTLRLTNFRSPLHDTFACNGEPLLLDAAVAEPAASYRWSTGDTSPQIRINGPGTYSIDIASGPCRLSDTILVRQKDVYLFIGGDKESCKGDPVSLSANIPDAISYLWSTGEQGRDITVQQDGSYILTIAKDGCTVSDTADIRFINCDNCAAIPNAFSPDNNGTNDRFKPMLRCPPVIYELLVYNRWGQEVFHTDDPAASWDGNFRGKTADGNVFFYLLRISYKNQDPEPQVLKGELILVR